MATEMRATYVEDSESKSSQNEVKQSLSYILSKPIPNDKVNQLKRLLAREKNSDGIVEYNKKNYKGALHFFKLALTEDPTLVSIYNNIARTYFQQHKYSKCLSISQKAITVGHKQKAPREHIATAMMRIGKVYRKQNKYNHAEIYASMALEFHRSPKIEQLHRHTKSKREDCILIDELKSQEQSEKANIFYEKGDLFHALKYYTTAIALNTKDPQLYSKRAACFVKMSALDLALRDCRMCIELDNECIKAYICKANILMSKKEYLKAAEYFQKAISLDAENAEACKGYKKCTKILTRKHKTPVHWAITTV